jgi:antitoxin MazE
MNLHIAKWGNSLAVRIPAEYVKAMGVREGDSVDATLTADGGISIRPAKWDREAFMRELAALHATMPMTDEVVVRMRQEARY